ncbi:MAG: type II toxin-antitoxin system RelE/ParE family toxin [Planctomycetaceae bacterium]|nr:type II toxin-antitoxin system RelE/ParE family toxin [Planctomycetaceae bacterium]
MTYHVKQYPPAKVVPEESNQFPEAQVELDAAINEMRRQGPSPAGFNVKSLGAVLGGLYQLNLRVKGKQIRILYAPYGTEIILFHIHKKTSPQEQKAGYSVAMARKKEYERKLKEQQHAGNRTVH